MNNPLRLSWRSGCSFFILFCIGLHFAFRYYNAFFLFSADRAASSSSALMIDKKEIISPMAANVSPILANSKEDKSSIEATFLFRLATSSPRKSVLFQHMFYHAKCTHEPVLSKDEIGRITYRFPTLFGSNV